MANLPKDLHALQDEIQGHARDFGLDFFPMIFELLDYQKLNQIATFGEFPTHYPH